ncbi:WD40 repeat domain-containing protein [Catellatospora methionotrophica]|uniref:WD40 repeat domain-containing protein n=1 Tax=Catellatospora methionotrophica TaxID=121620 RepID=UPI0033E85EE6
MTTFWRRHLHLSPTEARDTYADLVGLGLISRADDGSAAVAVAVRPTVLRVARESLRRAEEALPAVVRHEFLPAHELDGTESPWWRLASTSRYLHRNLPRHLRLAGHDARATALSRDFRWVHRVAALADVDAAVGELRQGGDSDRQLADALARAASRIEAARTDDERTRRVHPGSPAEALRHALLDVFARTLGTPSAGTATTRLATRWSTMPQPGIVLAGTFAADTRPGELRFSPDGSLLASLATGQLRVWEPVTGRVRAETAGSDPVFAPDWSWVATRDTDGAAVQGLRADRFTHRIDDPSVYDLAAAQDGTWLATVSRPGTVRLWNTRDGGLRWERREAGLHLGPGVAPDGSWLLVTRPGGGTLWDPSTGTMLGTLAHDNRDAAFAELVAPDSSWLVTCDRSGDLILWDARTARRRALLTRDLPWPRWRVGAPDSSWLLVTGEEGPPRVWRAADGTLAATLDAHGGRLTGCQVAPDGTWLATSGTDGLVRVWDTQDWTVAAVLESRGTGFAACLTSPEGSWLATRRRHAPVQLWDPRTWSVHAELDCVDLVDQWAAAPDGSLLATGHDGAVRVWRTAQAATVTHDEPPAEPHDLLAPNAPWLATHGAGSLRVYDASTGGVLWASGDVGDSPVWAAPADGSWLAAVGADGSLRVCDPFTGAVLCRLSTGGGAVNGCAAAGNRLVAVSADGRLRCWDTGTWQLCADWDGGLGPLDGCLIAPDGAWLAAGGGGTVRVWDVDGRPRAQIEQATLRGAIVAPSGRWIGTVDHGRVSLWDTSEGNRLAEGGWHGSLHRCAVSPDETWVGLVGLHANQYGFSADALPVGAFTDEDGFGLLVDCPIELAVDDISPSPDGRRAATAGGSGPVRVWDAATWQPVAAAWPDGRVHRCGWLGDGTALWTMGKRGLQIFDLVAQADGRQPTEQPSC